MPQHNTILKKISHPIIFLPIVLLRFLYNYANPIYPTVLKAVLWLLYTLKLRRSIIRKNLEIVFPERSKEFIDKHVKQSYTHVGELITYFFVAQSKTEAELKDIVDLVGFDEVLKAKAEHGSVILLTCHLGLWEIPAILPIYGLELGLLADRMSNPYYQNWIESCRTAFGAKMIYKTKNQGLTFAKYIKNSVSIGMVADLAQNDNGLEAIYFGRATTFGAGPYRLALAFDIPLFFVKTANSGKKYQIDFKQLTPRRAKNNAEKDKCIELMLKEYIEILEQSIKADPGQYYWFNRRFKKEVGGFKSPY